MRSLRVIRHVVAFTILALLFSAMAGCGSDTPEAPQQVADAPRVASTKSTPTLAPTPTPTRPSPTPTLKPPSPTATAVPIPLSISVSPDVTIEAKGSDGATLAYSQPSVNGGVGSLSVSCKPLSGSVFKLGTTVVTCTGQDEKRSVTKTFSVTVSDSIPPTLEQLADRDVTAALASGPKTVFFDAPKATDDVDSSIDVRCTPKSGYPFPIGSTKVTCVGTDDAGNETHTSFTVTVNKPEIPPRERSTGCPAAGQGQTTFPVIPTFIKGAAVLDGVSARDGLLVFARMIDATAGRGLTQCDTKTGMVIGGQFSLVLAPPKKTNAWLSGLTFYLDGRLAIASGSISASSYVDGGSMTIDLEAKSP